MVAIILLSAKGHANRFEESSRKMEIQSTVRGHHIYKAIWTPVIWEELTVRKARITILMLLLY